MYNDMNGFVGKGQIFGHALDVVDSDCLDPPFPRHFGRSLPTPRVPLPFVMGSPTISSAHTSETPTEGMMGDDHPGNTGRKRKSFGTNNLVDSFAGFYP